MDLPLYHKVYRQAATTTSSPSGPPHGTPLPAHSPTPAPRETSSCRSPLPASSSTHWLHLGLGGWESRQAKRKHPRERRRVFLASSSRAVALPLPPYPPARPVPAPSEPAACRSGERAEAMQHEPWRPGAEPAAGAGAGPAPTTVDEASMERSMSFVKALQVSQSQSQSQSMDPTSSSFPPLIHPLLPLVRSNTSAKIRASREPVDCHPCMLFFFV